MESLLQLHCGISCLSLSNGAGSLLKPAEELSRITELLSYRAQVWIGVSWPGLRSKLHNSVGTLKLEIYCFVINVLSLPREMLPVLPSG